MLSAVFTVLIILCIVYLWPARLGGGTNMVVVRGTSMEPVYHLSDVVIAREADSYAVGDIVVFSIPEGVGEGMLVIHRLVGQRDDGSWITQGDNRDTPDQFELHDKDLHGKPIFVAPRAGKLILLAGNVYVLSATVGMIVILLLWPKRPVPAELASAQQPAAGPLPEALEPDLAWDLEWEPEPVHPTRISVAVAGLIAAEWANDARLTADLKAQDVAAEAEEWLANELARLGVMV